MSCWHWLGKALSVTGMLVWVVLSSGCNREEAPPPAPAQSPGEQTNTGAAPAPEAPAPTTGATMAPAARGVVLASRELGMNVSGPGAGTPGRALDVLEHQINVFLPDILDAYEQARMQEPTLMGSLDVAMTIEANGRVSEVRFPVKRVSHDRLTAVVFDQMRNWIFPQADSETQFRFMMLFVPPGMDEASILLWEKRLGNRSVIEKSGDTAAPVAMAAAHLPEKETWDTNPRKRQEEPLAAPSVKSPLHAKSPAPPAPSLANKGKTESEEIIGWYRVLYPSMLRAEPSESAKALTRLQKGTRVRVVRIIKGQWLEVRSIANRPPGFLWWEDAMAEREERVEQR